MFPNGSFRAPSAIPWSQQPGCSAVKASPPAGSSLMKWLRFERKNEKSVILYSAFVAVRWFSASPFADFFSTHFFILPSCSVLGPEGRAEFTPLSPVERRDSPAGDRGRAVSAARDPPGRGGGGKAAAVPGRVSGGSGPCPGGARQFPGAQPAVPGARRRWRCRRSPARPGPALPRLGRGNDLRGNLGRAGRARGSGGAGDVPAVGGRSGGGRQVGGAAVPGSPCPARGTRGLLSPGPASSSGRWPWACASRGLERREAAARVPAGSAGPAAPGKRRLGAGGSPCGSVGMG